MIVLSVAGRSQKRSLLTERERKMPRPDRLTEPLLSMLQEARGKGRSAAELRESLEFEVTQDAIAAKLRSLFLQKKVSREFEYVETGQQATGQYRYYYGERG